jgi:hypothetical protein
MVYFSITAPRFSDKQDKEEERNLSPREAEEIKGDAYGRHQNEADLETPELIEEALKDFDEALDGIHGDTKAAYLEALDKAHETEMNEAFKLRFIRCCRMDAEVCMYPYVNISLSISQFHAHFTNATHYRPPPQDFVNIGLFERSCLGIVPFFASQLMDLESCPTRMSSS